MANQELEQLYQVLDQTTTQLRKALHASYLDAMIETGENMLANRVHQESGAPSDELAAQLMAQYQTVNLAKLDADTIRQAWQLMLVKAIDHDQIEANKQVTPDAMASLAAFVVTTFLPQLKGDLTISDLAVGSGNLLFAMMNQLQQALAIQVTATGVDNDERLLAFAGMSAQMQRLDVALYHQDAIDHLQFGKTDIVVSDLPVGYYPLDDRAKTFALAAESGHSYAHHLMIEQGMKMVKPGGLGLFYVPSTVFQSKEAKRLTEWLAHTAYFQGLMQLPTQFFGDAQHQKSLLILQQPGGNSHQVAQVLLSTMPAIEDRQAFAGFVQEVRQWAQTNIQGGNKTND